MRRQKGNKKELLETRQSYPALYAAGAHMSGQNECLMFVQATRVSAHLYFRGAHTLKPR